MVKSLTVSESLTEIRAHALNDISETENFQTPDKIITPPPESLYAAIRTMLYFANSSQSEIDPAVIGRGI